MNLCRSLLADLATGGRALDELFDGCEGARMRRLMRFARLGLVEIDAHDRVLLTDSGRTVSAALTADMPADLPQDAEEAEALAAFERQVYRLVGPPLAAHRSAA